MMKEFNKINNLTQREAAEFLAENNLEIDEEIYNYLKQMTLVKSILMKIFSY